MGLELNTGSTQQTQQNQANMEMLEKMASLQQGLNVGDDQIKAAVAELAPILSAMNVTITPAGESGDLKAGKITITLEVPDLDGAETYSKTIDLEALLLLLQLENDEHQLQVAKTRIEALKGSIEADHLSSLNSIENSITEAKEAEEAAKKQKRRGIIGAIVGLVLMVGITIVTGGGAAALIIGLAVTAAVAVINKTGLTDKLADFLSNVLQKMHVPKDVADKIAHALVAVVELVVAIYVTVKCPGKLKNSKLGKKLHLDGSSKSGSKLEKLPGESKVESGKAPEAPETQKTQKTQKSEEFERSEKTDDLERPEKDEEIEKKEKTDETEEAEKTEESEEAEKTEEAEESEGTEEESRPSEQDANVQSERDSRAEKYMAGVMIGETGLNTVSKIQTAIATNDADLAAAAVKELQAYLKEHEARLDEENEFVQMILEMMSQHMAALADVLEAQSQCNIKITQHIGG